ncbi:MAG: PP2C family protein-serine/threonine phosphatase [Fervidobacterium sp.]
MQESEKLIEIVNACERIARVFDKSLGYVDNLDVLSKRLEDLANYIEQWVNDQKANNDALQQLIEAQLEELTASYEGLSALFEINKIISSVDEPWMILQNVLKLLRNAVDYTFGIVKLKVDDKVYVETYNPGGTRVEEVVHFFDSEVENLADTLFVDYDKEKGGYILIPLISELGNYGYLGISNMNSKRSFTAGDKKITEAVAHQLLTAVSRHIMMKREIEKKRLEEQLQIARNIQQGLLPSKFPVSEKFDISAKSISAVQVGGDYYDVIENSDGSIICCIADVSGKGLPAALIMSSFRSMFRLSGKVSNDLVVLASQFDSMIHSDFEIGRFITSIIFKIFPNGRTEIVNAGHDPLYVVRGNKILKIGSTGTPFGILGDGVYELEVLEAEKGDVFVAFTDGVVEARNIQNEEFGFERLDEIVLRYRYLKASDIVDKIMSAVFEFSSGAMQHDDTTVLVLKYG